MAKTQEQLRVEELDNILNEAQQDITRASSIERTYLTYGIGGALSVIGESFYSLLDIANDKNSSLRLVTKELMRLVVRSIALLLLLRMEMRQVTRLKKDKRPTFAQLLGIERVEDEYYENINN